MRQDLTVIGSPAGLFLRYSIRALLTPPALRERRHRGLACRRVAVRRRAVLMSTGSTVTQMAQDRFLVVSSRSHTARL